LRELLLGGAIIIFLFIGLALVITGPAVYAFGDDSVETLAAELATAGVWNLGIIIVVRALTARTGASWENLGFRRPGSPGTPTTGILLMTIGSAYIACILVLLAYSVAIELLGLDELVPAQQVPDQLYDHAWLLGAFALLGVTLVPVAEELFFRGFIFAGLRHYLALPVAALISGLLFSLAHADPGLILPFAAVGAILAISYERTQTLLAPIGVHTLFNLVSFIFLAFVPDARPS
jgi:membrane protease YdiL (CAAX protease family)